MLEIHNPRPYANDFGGGIKCTCGWHDAVVVDRHTNHTMRDVWAAFRDHWEDATTAERHTG